MKIRIHIDTAHDVATVTMPGDFGLSHKVSGPLHVIHRWLWSKACRFDKITPHSASFVVFSADNPFQAALNHVGSARLKRYHETHKTV